MVIEKSKAAAAAAPGGSEIISINDLINPGKTAATDDGLARIENLMKLAEKGMGMLDKGITITGKFQNIVENVTGVMHHKMAVQQQPLQQAIPEPVTAAPLQGDPTLILSIQGSERALKTGDVQNYITALENTVKNLQEIEASVQAPPVSTDTIISVLNFVLEQKPDLTVQQLITLITENQSTLDKLIQNPQALGLLKLGQGFLKKKEEAAEDEG